MNIYSLIEKINLFEELVMESSFNRDLQEYITSSSQQQNKNTIYLKDITNRLIESIQVFYDNGLDEQLEIVLKNSTSFLNNDNLEGLLQLLEDEEINGTQYHQKLNVILRDYQTKIKANNDELVEYKQTFKMFVDEDYVETKSVAEDEALISLIFNDVKSTGTIKGFIKILNKWNRTLLIYHNLLSSESPDDIELVEIQNGSIDVIFNIDVDIAVDLVELMKTGLKVYGAYLLYKSKKAKEIIDSYMGNKKLIEMEEKRETLMLDNIKDSMKKKAIEQHKERLENDPDIEKGGHTKRAETVAAVLTEHIIKGNEIKLLAAPRYEEEPEVRTELREESSKVKTRHKELPEEEKLLLLEKYELPEE